MVFYLNRKEAGPICIKSIFSVLLNLLNVLIARTIYKILQYNHFLLLIYLGVITLELYETMNKDYIHYF